MGVMALPVNLTVPASGSAGRQLLLASVPPCQSLAQLKSCILQLACGPHRGHGPHPSPARAATSKTGHRGTGERHHHATGATVQVQCKFGFLFAARMWRAPSAIQRGGKQPCNMQAPTSRNALLFVDPAATILRVFRINQQALCYYSCLTPDA